MAKKGMNLRKDRGGGLTQIKTIWLLPKRADCERGEYSFGVAEWADVRERRKLGGEFWWFEKEGRQREGHPICQGKYKTGN